MLGSYGNYRITGEISRGGMGVVYAAVDATSTPVALKVLQQGGALDVARFRREAELLARLRHPGIVGLRDFGVVQGTAYLVMDLVEGQSLETLWKLGPVDPQRAAGWIAQAAEALEHAHSLGIVHRDVKPSNLILRNDGRLVVVDFGLAVVAEARDERLTRTGELLGTPLFMAPEQVETDPAGPAADVYGLGATLYTLVAGRPPFEGNSLMEVFEQVRTAVPKGLRAVAPATPRWLEDVCRRCLRKRPEQRFSGAAELAAAIRQAEQPRSRRAPLALGLVALLGFGGVVGWALASPAAKHDPQLTEGGTSAPAPPDPHLPDAPADQELVFRLGAGCGADTAVNEWALYCNDNFGANGTLISGMRREGNRSGERIVYIRFPLDRLPAAATIESAELVLTPYFEQAYPLEAHHVLEPWIEGTSTHDDTVDGMAWGSRRGSPLPAELAHAPFSPAPIARSVELEDRRVAFDLTALVQRWARGEANHGIALRIVGLPLSDGHRVMAFYSREFKDELRRPLVRIRYHGLRPRASAWTRPPDPDPGDLEALHAHLRDVPGDTAARLARARHYARRFDGLSHAAQDVLTAASHLPKSKKGPLHVEIGRAARQLFDDVLHATRFASPEEQRTLPKLITVLEVAWRMPTPETVGPDPFPSQAARKLTLERRITESSDMGHATAVWKLAVELWPAHPNLRFEAGRLLTQAVSRQLAAGRVDPRTAQHFLVVLNNLLTAGELDTETRAQAQAMRDEIQRALGR